jgi:predicted 2-oxoglutarate/Fe(II)-dependent dioxygenase YbiX
MTPPRPEPFDLFLVRDFFDAPTCERLAAEMRSAAGRPATVYGRGESGAVDERVRRAVRVSPPRETAEFVKSRLLECKAEVAAHFGVGLGDCEDPQFLRYGPGDFFVAHQDGNTGLLRLEREATRRVSTVIFLSRQAEAPEPDAFCGGSLVFSDWRGDQREFSLSGEPGTLVAFRAETTHEVTPVTHGERLSIASWYV